MQYVVQRTATRYDVSCLQSVMYTALHGPALRSLSSWSRLMHFQSRRAYAVLSVGAALVTMALKVGAYALTGSVGILSDALESLVNLVAALVAVWALTLAARPADDVHAYGHSKAEYFSSGVEGALIALAAALIALEAVPRLLYPQPIEQPGWVSSLRQPALPSTEAWPLCSGVLVRAFAPSRCGPTLAICSRMCGPPWVCWWV